MKVSVIVLSRNSSEHIDRAIVSLLNQHYYDMEVIVVDNFSTDGTRERVEPLVDLVLLKGPERTAQANYGISKARGEMIYLTASDMTRDYDFIKECVDKIREGYDAIYMSVRTDKDVKHFWGRVKALERESYIGTYLESARFFRKDVWEKLGGFNEDMIAMEEDFQHRLDSNGYITGRIRSREYHLHEDDSLIRIFRKAFYYGKYQRAYLWKHKLRGLKQLNPARPNLKLFLEHPRLLGGLIIYKLVQYIGGGLGLLCG